METDSYKMAIIVRDDLKMPKGKIAAQCAHAAVEAVLKTDRKKVDAWKREGQKKVVLKASDEKELLKLKTAAEADQLKTALITDAGLTVVAPGTVTCLAIGPDVEEEIDIITGKLKLL